MSNDDVLYLIRHINNNSLNGDLLKHVVLFHISKEHNNPRFAVNKIKQSCDLKVCRTYQRKSSRIIKLG